MSDLRKSVEMALEVLEHFNKGESQAIIKDELVYEIATLRKALVQSEQDHFRDATKKVEWVGLTEQDVHDAFQFCELVKQLSWERDRPEWCQNFAAYCEAKLKEKNGG